MFNKIALLKAGKSRAEVGGYGGGRGERGRPPPACCEACGRPCLFPGTRERRWAERGQEAGQGMGVPGRGGQEGS